MSLFNLKKNNNGCCDKNEKLGNEYQCGCKCDAETNEASCCCGKNEGINYEANIDSIKVLGSGCKSCHELFENVKKAMSELGINIEVEYITDMEKIMMYGVMSMPALVINDNVVSMGKVLRKSDVIALASKLELYEK